MNEIIERVAKALGGGWFDGDPEAAVSNYPGQTEKYREMYRAQARAAIDAMREPTEEMISAGAEEVRDLDVEFSPRSEPRRGAREAYRAMIHQILAGE